MKSWRLQRSTGGGFWKGWALTFTLVWSSQRLPAFLSPNTTQVAYWRAMGGSPFIEHHCSIIPLPFTVLIHHITEYVMAYPSQTIMHAVCSGQSASSGSGIPRSESLLCLGSFLDDLGAVTHFQPYLPYEVVVRIKWRRGEQCCKNLWVPTLEKLRV